MGRPRVPLDLKIARNTFRADRDAPPKLSSALASGDFDETPPAQLGEAGKAAWHEYLPILKSLAVLTIAGRPSLVSVCEKHDDLANAKAAIARDGELYDLPNGCKAKHPGCQLRDKAEKTISEFRRQFGMTPASMASIGLQPPKPLSTLARFKLSTGESMLPTRNRNPEPRIGPWRVVTIAEYEELIDHVYFNQEISKEEKDRALTLLCESIDPRPHAVAAREREQTQPPKTA